MYGIHPLEDLIQYNLGLNNYWAGAIACAVVFPLICAGLAEITHGKKFHDITPPHKCPDCRGSGRISNGKYPKYDVCPTCKGVGRV